MSAEQLLSTASTAPCTRSLRFACASTGNGSSHTAAKAHTQITAVFQMVVIADPSVVAGDLDRKRRTLWQMLGANNREKPAKGGPENT
jgi:hypothetical protein